MKKSMIAAVLVLMAGGAYAAEFGDLAVDASGLRAAQPALAAHVPAVRGITSAARPAEFVHIPGGSFMMGTNEIESIHNDAMPVHSVAIKAFEMSKTPVTVEQYAECVSARGCSEPGTGGNCNWGMAGREQHPVNCVTWDQASRYAAFKGFRLPSEAEWEYAARSGGKNNRYPWGNETPSCDKAVICDTGRPGCSNNGTMPVCSRTAGNTGQGLCDMAGNVLQWTQDTYHVFYKTAPADGSALEDGGAFRVLRGSSFYGGDASAVRTDYRNLARPEESLDAIGFRVVKAE